MRAKWLNFVYLMLIFTHTLKQKNCHHHALLSGLLQRRRCACAMRDRPPSMPAAGLPAPPPPTIMHHRISCISRNPNFTFAQKKYFYGYYMSNHHTLSSSMCRCGVLLQCVISPHSHSLTHHNISHVLWLIIRIHNIQSLQFQSQCLISFFLTSLDFITLNIKS